MKNIIKYNSFLKLIPVAIIMLLLNSGCKKAAICDCIKGTGNTITESRSTPAFYYVEVKNKTNLHYHYDKSYRITVTAGEKLIDKLTTEVTDGVLRIENKNKCNWVRNFNNEFSVDIYAPEISTLEIINSSGNVYFDDTLKTEEFHFESWESSGDYFLKLNCNIGVLAMQTGQASLNVSGEIGVAFLWNSGGGRYDALAFHADDIYSTNIGTNDMYIFPEKRLEATIGYSGNIYIKGNPPSIQLKDNGAGKFITL